MTGQVPRIWVLLGERQGDNNQVLALAEALGLPFETRSLRYNLLRALSGTLLGRSIVSVHYSCRRWLVPPWPELVIAIGRRSVPVARWIQRNNSGRTRIVRVGHPRIDPKLFDLVITTRQYPVPPGDNVVLLPLAMSRYRTRPMPTEDERTWLTELPRPHLLMAIGGATKYWELTSTELANAATQLCERAVEAGGSVIVIGSPRTDRQTMEKVQSVLNGKPNCKVLTTNRLRFPVLLADADENFVTGDSVSMISEAVLTGKPVGLIPVKFSRKGRRKLAENVDGGERRDLRRFWRYLQAEGLIGTVDQPRSGQVADPVKTAAIAVRQLLGYIGE